MATTSAASGTSADEGRDAPIMKGNIIDGKAVAARIRDEITKEVAALKATYGKVPGLAVVIVGARKDSQTYVRMKRLACEEVGIVSFGADLPETASQEEVLATVAAFNANPDVHGILVQLPLPKHINEQVVLDAISLEKDVDGFHPLNVGHLSMRGRDPFFVPCTPLGCIELLEKCNVPIKGKRAVVVGRSNIVGMPASMLLLHRNATVTICHSGTSAQDMEVLIRQADIVLGACGQAGLIKGSWIKPGAAVIDVGTNPVPDASKKSGFKLVGDVEFAEASKVAGAITPVPGGVGPMTIAMLLSNTLKSAKRCLEESGQGAMAPPGSTAQSQPAPMVSTCSKWLPGDGHKAMTLAVGAALMGALLREGVSLVSRSLRRA